MQFKIKNRDGPARIGEMTINSETLCTPTLAFLDTKRYPAPPYAPLLLSKDACKKNKPIIEVGNSIFSLLKNKNHSEVSVHEYLIYPYDVSKELYHTSLLYNIKNDSECCLVSPRLDFLDEIIQQSKATLFIVTNSAQIFSQQSKIVEFLTTLREKIGYEKMIYLPSIADPSTIALFSYLGVDVFDSVAAIVNARKKILFFSHDNIVSDTLVENPCMCPVCCTEDDASNLSFEQILQHNYFALYSELKHVRNAIAAGNLRELVEYRVSSRPHLSAMLKILDKNHYNFLEQRTPMIRKNVFCCVTKHCLDRVEIKRFQSFLLSRYSKPKSAKILLLLPCSAKKPYSFSKSHRLFKQQFETIKNMGVVHEVILTSPLGVVPRDIELIYPASRYDISVSGYWDEEEKKMIHTLLQSYGQHNQYDEIVVHVDASIQDFIVQIFDNPRITCISQPTSKQSLELLHSSLKTLTQQYDFIKPSTQAFEAIFSLACFQFGRKNAELLLENCKIVGKYPYQKIMEHNTQLGMITKERGFISLTLDGAAKLVHSKQYCVDIEDDFDFIGSVFAPAVKDADETIRIGDEVLVMRNKKLCGVGVAMMNGKEMKQLWYGEAVKVRHRC